jgi:4-amino-4-deoxy-L-arabinose transferase-like glycosyltransferase
MSLRKNHIKDENHRSTGIAIIWPWIAILMVIIAAVVIRSRLLSIPFERDEGEYAYIAQQMLNGIPPYVSAYSMKLPGIYIVYALIMAVFGQTHTAVHLGLLIYNAATIFIIFLFAKKCFGTIAGVMAGGTFAVTSLLYGVTGLWANSEHFVILPAILGIFLLCVSEKTGQIRLLISGLLFGFAFITKQHGIFFAVFGSLYLLYFDLHQRPIRWIKIIISQVVFYTAVMVPFIAVCLFYWLYGTFGKFWFWTFTYAHKYTTNMTLSHGWVLLRNNLNPIIKESSPVWLLAIIGMIAVIILKRYRHWAVFSIGLFIFSFLAVCPGLYFRNHYFIFILPVLAASAGLGLTAIDALFQKLLPAALRVIVTGVVGLAVIGYTLYDQRGYLFNLSPDDVCREVYGANPFPQSLPIADFIRNNSDQNDTVAVFGSEPQIYFYSGRRSITPYIYMYPLMEPNPFAENMQKEIIAQVETVKPDFIILVRVSTSWSVLPESKTLIFEWLTRYIEDSYETVGLIDIPPSGHAVYYWRNMANNRTPVSPFWVAVFKRR